MRVLWFMAKSLRWALLVASAGFFGMSMVYVDQPESEFEIYIELFLGALALALLVGYFERSLRKRRERSTPAELL